MQIINKYQLDPNSQTVIIDAKAAEISGTSA
jgi:hypothetical protein